MQEMKFIFDSNVPGAVTDQLVKRGVDAIRCEDVGMADVHDLALLDYATREQRTLVTADKGFSGWSAQWLEQGRSHSGIFIVTRDKENIGMILSELLFWYEGTKDDQAALENEVYNQVLYIP